MKITEIQGIPIRAHGTLLILLPLILLNLPPAQWGWGILGMVGLFGCVALHELGHSLTAMRRGFRVLDITLLPIGGLARMDRAPERPGDEFVIALAGPAVSLFLAVFFRLLYRLLDAGPFPALANLAGLLAGVNLVLAVFNLLPSFPMDGGRIFRAWLTPFFGRLEATRRAAKLGRTLAVIFGVWSVLRLNLLHLAIAIFVFMAAGAEYRMVVRQEMLKRRFGTGIPDSPPHIMTESDADVYVSPPPYAARRASGARFNLFRRIRSVFEDLAGRE